MFCWKIILFPQQIFQKQSGSKLWMVPYSWLFPLSCHKLSEIRKVALTMLLTLPHHFSRFYVDFYFHIEHVMKNGSLWEISYLHVTWNLSMLWDRWHLERTQWGWNQLVLEIENFISLYNHDNHIVRKRIIRKDVCWSVEYDN